MADIDLKAATPDTSVPGGAFVFGADSQSATAPSVFPLSRISEVAFSFDASNQEGSLAHMTGWSVGDVVRVKHWDASRQDGSSMLWRCWQVGSGTVGAITNAGAEQGIQMQGNGVRWLAVPTVGNIIDIRAFGLVCDGVTELNYSRWEQLRAAAQARGLTLTWSGFPVIRRSVDARFASIVAPKSGFNAGGAEAADFYPDDGTNIRVAIATTNPGVITTKDAGGTTIAHTIANDQQVMFNVAKRGSLPQDIERLKVYYAVNVDQGAGTFQIAATAGGAAIDLTVNSTELTTVDQAWVYLPTTVSSNFQIVYIPQWDGTIKRKAYAVIAAGNGPVNKGIRQWLSVRGDGNFDHSIEPTCIGFDIQGDDSPLGEYDFDATYCYSIGTPTGAFEKKELTLRGSYCTLPVYVPKGSSADTLKINLQITRCRAAYWEYPGVSVSAHIYSLFESRDDPGDDRPAYWVRSGKFCHLDGRLRAANGTNHVLADKAEQGGADTLRNDMVFIDTYGRVLDYYRVRRLSGHAVIYDSKKSATWTDHPAVRFGQIAEGAAHTISLGNIADVDDQVGVTVGEAGGVYSRDCVYPALAIQMGNELPFRDSGIENTGTPFPVGKVALNVVRAKGGHLRLLSCMGNIVVGSDVLAESGRPLRIEIPREQYRYTRTIDPAAVIEIGAPALLDSSGKVALTQIPQNVVDGSGINVTFNPLTGQSTIALDVDGPGASWSEVVLGTDATNDTTTQTAVTALKFTPAANKRYIVEGWIAHTANVNGTGVRVGITMPSGLVHAPVQIVSANGAAASQSNNNTVSSGNTASTAANSAGAVACMTFIRAIVIAGASPDGDVQVTVASELASNLVTVLAGSVLRWRDIG